jgi:hypothetical protein
LIAGDDHRWVLKLMAANLGIARRGIAAMTGRDTAFSAPFERWMDRHQTTGIVDPDLVGKRLHLDHAAARAVGDAVEVAVDGDQPVVGDTTLKSEHRSVSHLRQREQLGLFFHKRILNTASRGSVAALVRYL